MIERRIETSKVNKIFYEPKIEAERIGGHGNCIGMCWSEDYSTPSRNMYAVMMMYFFLLDRDREV